MQSASETRHRVQQPETQKSTLVYIFRSLLPAVAPARLDSTDTPSTLSRLQREGCRCTGSTMPDCRTVAEVTGEHDVNMYEIRVRGRLDVHWAAWFEGLTLVYEGDHTVLRGFLADEAALHGVLSKIAGLNLHLVSVNVIETGGTNADPSASSGA